MINDAMVDSLLQASVILCAYTEKRWDDLVKAISSLQHQDTPPGEIILVIDHNPHLYSMALEKFPGVRVMESRGVLGLSGARNTGAESSRFPLIVFMDEDATAERDWLARLLVSFQDDRVLGVGGSVIPSWPNHQPAWFPDEFAWVVGCSYKGMPENETPVRNMLGCNMSFRRDAFEKLGGFANNLGRLGENQLISCEETELCIRLNQKYPGSLLLYDPQARVNHKIPSYRLTWQYFIRRCFAEGVSKALVADSVGSKDGLSSEHIYVRRILPLGFLLGIKESLTHTNMGGFFRAGTILMGLAMTVLGYLSGKISPPPKFARDTLLKTS